MELRISVTDLARRLGDVLGRVRYRGDSFLVERNGALVAGKDRPGRSADARSVGPVIDTSALAAAKRGGAATALAAIDETAVVPTIVYAELLVGERLADTQQRREDRRAKIQSLISRVPLVEFSKETAGHWAELFVLLSRAGQMIPANNLAVAATARQLGFGVLIGRLGLHEAMPCR